VRARIVSSRKGELGSNGLRTHEKTPTRLKRVEVKACDFIDFVLPIARQALIRPFTWAPAIKFISEDGAPAHDQAGVGCQG